MTSSKAYWIAKLLTRMKKSDIDVISNTPLPHNFRLVEIKGEDWVRVAAHCEDKKSRLSSLWADEKDGCFVVTACYEKSGAFLMLRAALALKEPQIASLAHLYPAASRLERHCRDLLGIHFENSMDTRRWTRHQAWEEDFYPLRAASSPAKSSDKLSKVELTSDQDYEFYSVQGEAVYEIPVGPVHAGIIEPGHFRFQAVGELVINLEERLGYTHKGIEKIAVGRDIHQLLRLAGRVSGDTTVAHTWAACQAAENAAKIEVPERALFIRAILSERERVANHLGDIGAICNDVGFSFGQMQFSRLRELWQRTNQSLFGHRLLMDLLIPGGVNVHLDDQACKIISDETKVLQKEVHELFSILRNSQSLRGRLVNAGVLSTKSATNLGCLGVLARASNVPYDARLDVAYPPYDTMSLVRPLQTEGDVSARVVQRAEEIYASIVAIEQLLEKLPHGPIKTAWSDPPTNAEGLGVIEGWRGEIVTYVRFGEEGKIARFFPRDPSWFNWPALEVLIHNNIVPDFPVCNKSVNGSYSGHDL